ncbi:hypothetical protein [Aliidiomarina indica]|uniref:hypothetical protein n=1 Tax=Aliidiomarina indica TaxID=2749147 RepID=UPI00188E58C8|nr:hypothetical protein [Aliidiomarina indica]
MRYSQLLPTSASLSAVMLTLFLAGCTPQNGQQVEETDASSPLTENEVDQEMLRDDFTFAELEALRLQVHRTIGTPFATDPSQCRVLPFGAKPCGGPSRYVIYSIQETDPDVIEPLVDQYNTWSEIYNEREGLMSDCAVVPEVSATVINGICVPTEYADR